MRLVSSGPLPLPDEPADGARDSVRVPDDARDLALEAQALRRELAARRRRQRWSRVFRTRRWERFGLSGPLVTAVLALVAVVGSLVVVLGPRPPVRLTAQPLADVPVGGEGGLLTAVTLHVGTRPVEARALRPAVLALVPDGCSCAAEAESAIGQAASVQLPTYLVAAPDAADDVDAMRATRRVRPEQTLTDPDGALAAAYAADPRGLTLLLVRSDGVVAGIVRGLSADRRLERDLVDVARASGLDAG
jgi:hypothetical protein